MILERKGWNTYSVDLKLSGLEGAVGRTDEAVCCGLGSYGAALADCRPLPTPMLCSAPVCFSRVALWIRVGVGEPPRPRILGVGAGAGACSLARWPIGGWRFRTTIPRYPYALSGAKGGIRTGLLPAVRSHSVGSQSCGFPCAGVGQRTGSAAASLRLLCSPVFSGGLIVAWCLSLRPCLLVQGWHLLACGALMRLPVAVWCWFRVWRVSWSAPIQSWGCGLGMKGLGAGMAKCGRCGVQVIGVVLIGVVCIEKARVKMARVRNSVFSSGVFTLLGATWRGVCSVGGWIDFCGWGGFEACRVLSAAVRTRSPTLWRLFIYS
jgi:hypothetical protein